MYLEVVPGCLVLESGTGSGSLTTSFARAVAPTGYVYTFDFHEQRAASARSTFCCRDTSLSLIVSVYRYLLVSLKECFMIVTMGVRDILGEGFPDQFSGLADSVFLDLLEPWLAIPSA
ncbi:tRNA (adenine(58)-N(1))-methyltransferase catalytic subunit TRMT61A-like [Gossypium hirsutum]|uniref:tRNA (adenine(58)-N(1))-methyltransferase n=1 Tax=Gossypium hirsutum TaxID=3635 RepID=A0ABM3AYM8_GOSHI|nr:tRNA (adenine(58)-N(1))-methyltransferase catalytic subunit TRMT61A-like [Gossypium hirsutum]